MTKVQFSLPDELARDAEQASLLAPEAMQTMLREKLRIESMARLEAAWSQADDAEASPADEQMIAEAIRKVRSTRKA